MFRARRFLAGGHVQTIASFLLRRRFALPIPEERLVEVEPGVCVLCHCHWQPEKESALTVVVVHGLEGSSESKYMMGVAEKGIAAGMNVVLMNQRTCGGTDRLAPTLYHSGRSADVAAVAKHVIDNDRTKEQCFPGKYDLSRLHGLKSLRDFDDKVTAFYCGFDGASDYYARSAAANVLQRISVPTFILSAGNDPFIRILPETRKKIEANANITFVETEDGGHCSFVGERNGYDGHFAEREVIEFFRKLSCRSIIS